MVTTSGTMRALCAGFGILACAAFGAASGCATAESADTAAVTDDGNVAETQEAFSIPCSNAGGTVAGALDVNFTPNGTWCFRTSAIVSGGAPPPPPPPGTPSCWQLAKQFGCIGF